MAGFQHSAEFNMVPILQRVSSGQTHLSEPESRAAITSAFSGRYSSQKVLVLIPDHTRTLPLPFLFRVMVDALGDTTKLDFLVALGTHPALNDDQLNKLVGISTQERTRDFSHVGLINHRWDTPSALKEVGLIKQGEVQEIAGKIWHPSLGGDVPIKINARIFDYDQIIILGPTFPHEVAGFSGGAKYLFPGISGPEIINTTHWLGALAGVRNTIGYIDTPVRKMIHKAAALLDIPITLAALVVEGHDLAGIFIGDYIGAWKLAVELSTSLHIKKCKAPFKKVLSAAPSMYDELWTAAKAMYKLDPVIADGGEIIIYAPHLKEVSFTHGKFIFEVGYHSLDFFLNQWERYKHVPLGILAHSTHVHGDGRYFNGEEHARIKVILASQISREDCRTLNLGYLDPGEINPAGVD
jgi:lactate racemase